MRARVSSLGFLSWQDGHLVWDDPVHHRRLALTPAAERVLRHHATWRPLDPPLDADPLMADVAGDLLAAGVLVAEGSWEHHEEERLLARWAPWPATARHFHHAARTLAGSRYLGLGEDLAASAERAAADPPPPAFAEHPDAPLVPIPAPIGDQGWARPRVVDALAERRSVRRWAPRPVALAELGALLHTGAGVVDVHRDVAGGEAVFRPAPSAGARNPSELYVHASCVDGLAPGLYHLAPTRGGLEALGPPRDRDGLLPALGGQPWLVDAPVLLVHTAVLARSQWRYDTARAYRDVVLGAGHLSQALLVAASAIGLGAVFATAVCDEELELLLGCDPGEVVLGVTAVGWPAPAS